VKILQHVKSFHTTRGGVERVVPAALARALNQIVGDAEAARRFGGNARKRYEELFTARRMAEQVRAMYVSLRI